MTDTAEPVAVEAVERALWLLARAIAEMRIEDVNGWPNVCEFAAETISSLQAQVEALTREVEHMRSSGIIEVAIRNPSVADYMNHWEGRAEAAEAEVTRLRQYVKGLDRTVDFVTLWAWRDDPPNASNNLTDSERLSAIKYHPTIQARTKEPNNV